MSPKSDSYTPVHYVRIGSSDCKAAVGQRIDNFLSTLLKGIPKTRLYRALRKGEVRVNKKRVSASYRLMQDDSIRIPPLMMPLSVPNAPITHRLQDLLLSRLLYENEDFLIVNKPSGVPVHGGTGVQAGVIEALRAHYIHLHDLELVHRLDKETSGCLIIAKKRRALKELHELFRTGKVEKIYSVLLQGHLLKNNYRIEAPLQKHHLRSGERMVVVDLEGKASVTLFERTQLLTHTSLAAATLKTGRTHQIRVHAQSIGHPVAGDEKYGDREFNKTMKQYGLHRLFLHATHIAFMLPSTGEKIVVQAPLDDDLKACLTALTLAKN